MQQLDNQNFNLPLEQQPNRQERRRVLNMGLTAFSLFIVILLPLEYKKNITIDTPAYFQINKTLESIQKHFALLEKIENFKFEGNWTDQQNSGLSLGYFSKYKENMSIYFNLKLISGQFYQDEYKWISYELTCQQLQLTSDDKIFNFTNVKIYESISNITFKFDNFINNNQTTENSLNNVQITINSEYYLKDNTDQSQTQKFQFQSILLQRNKNKVIIYSIIHSILYIIQIICFEGLRIQPHQFSIYIFHLININNFYIYIFTYYLFEQKDYYYISFILILIFSLPIAFIIFEIISQIKLVRSDTCLFEILFLLFTFIYSILLYYQYYYNLCLILVNLYLMPQIIHVAYNGVYVDFKKKFVFVLLGTRLFIPLYLRGCPYNVLHSQVSYLTCIIIVVLFIAQTIIYYFQCTIGPRFFLPKCLTPKTQFYFTDQSIDGECAICAKNLKDQPPETFLDYEDIPRFIRKNLNKLMKTPCEHYFHAICLTKWMNDKLFCPICRSTIPRLF